MDSRTSEIHCGVMLGKGWKDMSFPLTILIKMAWNTVAAPIYCRLPIAERAFARYMLLQVALRWRSDLFQKLLKHTSFFLPICIHIARYIYRFPV